MAIEAFFRTVRVPDSKQQLCMHSATQTPSRLTGLGLVRQWRMYNINVCDCAEICRC